MQTPFSISMGLAKGGLVRGVIVGSGEIENSRRARFSLVHYANKASKHDSETELINLILIS